MGTKVNGRGKSKTFMVKENLALPKGWTERTDPGTWGKYYYEEVSGRSHWERPTKSSLDDADPQEYTADQVRLIGGSLEYRTRLGKLRTTRICCKIGERVDEIACDLIKRFQTIHGNFTQISSTLHAKANPDAKTYFTKELRTR